MMALSIPRRAGRRPFICGRHGALDIRSGPWATTTRPNRTGHIDGETTCSVPAIIPMTSMTANDGTGPMKESGHSIWANPRSPIITVLLSLARCCRSAVVSLTVLNDDDDALLCQCVNDSIFNVSLPLRVLLYHLISISNWDPSFLAVHNR